VLCAAVPATYVPVGGTFLGFSASALVEWAELRSPEARSAAPPGAGGSVPRALDRDPARGILTLVRRALARSFLLTMAWRTAE
jgi:hypothetical protein